MNLSAAEIRVLGCLLEKQRTTPDAYPLSLNAVRLACNQSTNRDPVVDYDDAAIRDALHRLERRGFTRLASGAGSRAPKYRHLLAEALPMDDGEQALMCVLMLRGAQTPGELKQRSERMHAFGDLAAVHVTLEALIARRLAARLERRAGHKEERYAQLLQDQDEPANTPTGRVVPDPATAPTLAAAVPAQAARARDAQELELLGERVERLEREVAELRSAMRNPVYEHRP
ncbi:MAG: YceH family protein [Solirubrobacteraceae bacterium]